MFVYLSSFCSQLVQELQFLTLEVWEKKIYTCVYFLCNMSLHVYESDTVCTDHVPLEHLMNGK